MNLLKRSFDLLLTAPAFCLTAPLMMLLMVMVKSRLGAPVFFKQKRPGMNGSPFRIYKFRTMNNCRGPDGRLAPDCERLTPFGQWLRSTSLDELPELLNVVKGEMSLVGPRPLLMRYLDRYTPEQARRHEVKPGVTGWAQINGRNALTWEEKFQLDIWYVDNQSIWLDIKILLITVAKVLRREGISAAGEATSAEFDPRTTCHRKSNER